VRLGDLSDTPAAEVRRSLSCRLQLSCEDRSSPFRPARSQFSVPPPSSRCLVISPVCFGEDCSASRAANYRSRRVSLTDREPLAEQDRLATAAAFVLAGTRSSSTHSPMSNVWLVLAGAAGPIAIALIDRYWSARQDRLRDERQEARHIKVKRAELYCELCGLVDDAVIHARRVFLPDLPKPDVSFVLREVADRRGRIERVAFQAQLLASSQSTSSH
jgi:hypothetical protein